MPLPRRVHRRHVEQPADGLLPARDLNKGCAAPRSPIQAHRRDVLRLGLHTGGRLPRLARTHRTSVCEDPKQGNGSGNRRAARCQASCFDRGLETTRSSNSKRRIPGPCECGCVEFHFRQSTCSSPHRFVAGGKRKPAFRPVVQSSAERRRRRRFLLFVAPRAHESRGADHR